MAQIYTVSINGLFYAAITAILLFLVKPDLIWLKDVLKTRRRLRHRINGVCDNGKKNRLIEHLNMLAVVVLKSKTTGVKLLLIVSAIFLSVFIVGLQQFSVVVAYLLAAVIAFLPIGVLELKLSGIRSRGSREGESFVSSFLAKYRLDSFNVYESMADTVSENNNSPICCEQLYRTLLELRATGDPVKIRHTTERFSDAIDTNWSRVFAYNLYIAASYGINISVALEEILLQLRDARALEEERKRLNGEAVRIVVFLIPFVYVTTFLLNIFYLDMSYAQYVRNQFGTGTGLMLTAVIVIMFVVNLALLELVENYKFDY